MAKDKGIPAYFRYICENTAVYILLFYTYICKCAKIWTFHFLDNAIHMSRMF